MSKQGKPSKRKGSELRLRQPLMGAYVSKPKTTERKPKKKRFEKMSSFIWTRGSYMDTEEYRNNYPGKKDHPNWDDNYNFYMNRIPSKPDGDLIDNIHSKWWGDYAKLERHHGYIQWLFPIRDSGMNWHAQELQMHEIEKLTREKKAMERVLQSYKMMLDFYGMKLENEQDGTIVRSDKWRTRFLNLNRSYHNYLRITRILKCLGELNFEHLKANFVRFVLYEGIVKGTLPKTVDSCMKYWIGVIRSDEEREQILDYYDELCEQDVEKEEDEEEEEEEEEYSDYKISKYRESMQKVLASPSKVTKRQVSEEEMSDDDTLHYAMNLISSDSEDESNNKKEQKTDLDAKLARKDHEMSDSDEEFKTPDTGESQELMYWNVEKSLGNASLTHGSDAVEDDNESKEESDKPADEVPGKINGEKVAAPVDSLQKEPKQECFVDKIEDVEKNMKETVSVEDGNAVGVTGGKRENGEDGIEETANGKKSGTDEVSSEKKQDNETSLDSEKLSNVENLDKPTECLGEELQEDQGTESIASEKVKELNTGEEAGTEMETDDTPTTKDSMTVEATNKQKHLKLDGTEEDEEEENAMETEEDVSNTKL